MSSEIHGVGVARADDVLTRSLGCILSESTILLESAGSAELSAAPVFMDQKTRTNDATTGDNRKPSPKHAAEGAHASQDATSPDEGGQLTGRNQSRRRTHKARTRKRHNTNTRCCSADGTFVPLLCESHCLEFASLASLRLSMSLCVNRPGVAALSSMCFSRRRRRQATSKSLTPQVTAVSTHWLN